MKIIVYTNYGACRELGELPDDLEIELAKAIKELKKQDKEKNEQNP